MTESPAEAKERIKAISNAYADTHLEFSVCWQPKQGKPKCQVVTMNVPQDIPAGSSWEQSCVRNAFKQIRDQYKLSEFAHMWIAQIKTNDAVQKWENGTSPYVVGKADDKKALDEQVPNNPYTVQQWNEWAKPWVERGYKLIDEIPSILSAAQVARGGKSFTSVMRGWDSDMEAATAVMEADLLMRMTPAAEDSADVDPLTGQPDEETTVPKTEPTRPLESTKPPDAVSEVESGETQAALPVSAPTLDPLLSAKTLTGIPILKMQETIDRPYVTEAYSTTKAPGGGEWTVLDPLYVRARFDKVFGPHGLGWRIVPAEHGSSVTVTTYERKSGQQMYYVSLNAYCFEYLLNVNNEYMWQRTSAFTDANDSDDLGYAAGGAFTSLMKQALKMLGGYDHFIIRGYVPGKGFPKSK